MGMIKIYTLDKKNLKYRSIPLYLISILFIVLIGIGVILNPTIHLGKNTINHTSSVDTVYFTNEKFSEDALVKLLKETHARYPYIILAQAKVESGNFTSNIFKSNNNYLGMRKAYIRTTTAQGENDGFAVYRDYKDCLYDYLLYQSLIIDKIHNEEEYFHLLETRYAQDSIYVNSLKTIIKHENLKEKFEY